VAVVLLAEKRRCEGFVTPKVLTPMTRFVTFFTEKPLDDYGCVLELRGQVITPVPVLQPAGFFER